MYANPWRKMGGGLNISGSWIKLFWPNGNGSW